MKSTKGYSQSYSKVMWEMIATRRQTFQMWSSAPSLRYCPWDVSVATEVLSHLNVMMPAPEQPVSLLISTQNQCRRDSRNLTF